MFDIKWIRDNASAFDAGLKNRGLEPLSAKLLELDDARRRHLAKLQDAQSRRNASARGAGQSAGSSVAARSARACRGADRAASGGRLMVYPWGRAARPETTQAPLPLLKTVVLLLKNVSRTLQAPSKCSKTTKATMSTLVDHDFT